MILKGAQRGGPSQLAAHLMNDRDNDHVTLLELRGFISANLNGAMAEAHAISKATRCKQFLFSLNLSPPKNAEASVDTFIDAVDRAERTLGLQGQPRAIILHEKEGRRHAHAVWSRVDPVQMKAINLPHYKNRLCSLSKELYLDHGWDLPAGHKLNGWKNPLNFTLAEWQQAKRLDLDPREIKQIFRSAWERSDSRQGFQRALEEHGYFLARGDRRGFVAVDLHGEIFAVARWAGIKTGEVKARFGAPDGLPTVEETQERLKVRLSETLRKAFKEDHARKIEDRKPLVECLKAIVTSHRAERETLSRKQNERWRAETRERAGRLHTGIRGVWDLLTGRAREVSHRNELETLSAYRRDLEQRERLYKAQTEEREELRKRHDDLRRDQRRERMQLARRLVAAVWRKEIPTEKRSWTIPPPNDRRTILRL